MSVKKVIAIAWFVVCGMLPQTTFAQIEGFNNIKWTTEAVAPGITWKHAHTDALPGGQQNINILEIDTRKRKATLVYDKDRNRPTSELSREVKALASVNAGFFDMKNGGSTAYIKVDGTVPDKDTLKWKKHPRYDGALIITTKGKFVIDKRTHYRTYTSNKKYDDVLITGNLLMDDGKKVALDDGSFVTTKHPRTCLGIVSKNKILLVTVDGRFEQAKGMDLNELTNLMMSLGCTEAINLDGGGSTTMWIHDRGVVNVPSDNKKFDHEGERPVSNIIAIH
jgi:exopolysaccharide biosynthesis protein